MIDERLMQEAQRLAARPYAVSSEVDALGNGDRIFLLRNPELPAVKAQGDSIEEASHNLEEARVDYFYSLLEDGLPVPAPAISSITGSSLQGHIWTISGAAEGNDSESSESVIVALGGDLVNRT